MATTGKNVKAVISQCRFTSGWRSSLCTGIAAGLRLGGLGLLDTLFGSGEMPVTVSLTGKPGESE